jgi:hypothetical protein
MPALVAAQRLVAMLAGAHDRAVRLHVADGDRLLLGVCRQELDLAEATSERHLLRFRQVLAGEDQDGMVEESPLDRLPGGFVHAAEREVGDHRA